MALAHRIIPTILMKSGHLVKGEQFKADRIVGNALQAAKIHAMRGVDEILILDVDCSEPDFKMVETLTKSTTVPVTVGGGIHLLWDSERLFAAGADKISIGDDTSMIYVMASKYGSQAVVASLDVDVDLDYIDGAREQAEWLVEEGAGEILLQSIDRDGTMQGYDLDLIDGVANYVDVPVIASGGCSGYADMHAAIDAGASAVAAGALFQFTSATPRGAAKYLQAHGVEVRL
jgi:cyclase